MPAAQLNDPWLLLLLLPLAAAAIFASRHSLAGLDPQRARAVLTVRLALLGALVLALTEPTIDFPARARQVLFLLDRSRSLSLTQQQRQIDLINEAGRALPSDAQAGVVVFGKDAQLEASPQRPLSLRATSSVIDSDATDLGGALRLGAALLDEHTQRRLVVLSDGNDTAGEALAEAQELAGQKVQVDVVPVETQRTHDVVVEDLIAPNQAKIGEPVELRVVASSTYATSGTLHLLHNDSLVAEKPWKLQPGKNVLTFERSLTTRGFHRWEVVFDAAGDAVSENNRGMGFTQVQGTPRVLVVEGTAGDGSYLEAALRGRSLEVERRSGAGIPATLGEVQPFDAVVLANVRADQVTGQQMRVLRSGVRDLGIGLIMSGGENSFTAGGWRNTPVEEVLPVEMQVKRKADEPLVALLLVIDHSGSMGGILDDDAGKLNTAKRSAQVALSVVRPHDEVGVIAFSDEPRWIVPLKAGGNREDERNRIGGIQPALGTRMYPALAEARRALAASRAALKHVLVLTDGRSEPGDFAGVAAELARGRVTVSTVGVGPDADGKLLAAIAQRTGGRYYAAVRPEVLPFIFDREAQLATRAALVEESFRPRVEGSSELLRELPSVPFLRGYVATTAKSGPGIEVPLVSHRGEPVLALAREGLGKTMAVTTDARNRWAAPWLASGGFYEQFWTRAVRSVLRASQPGGVEVAVELRGNTAHVTVEALTAEGDYRNGVLFSGRVASPDNGHDLRLAQTAPGRYEGRFPAAARGQYLVAVREEGNGKAGKIAVSGVARTYSPEWRTTGANQALLIALAEKTGGQAWPTLGPAIHRDMLPRFFRPAGPARTAPLALWPYLLLTGAVLLPVDVALRRFRLNRDELTEVREAMAQPVMGLLSRRRPRGERDEMSERLLQAKARTFRGRRISVAEKAPETVFPAAAVAAPPVARTVEPKPASQVEPVAPSDDSAEPADSFSERLLAAKRRASGDGQPTNEPPARPGA